MDMNSALECEKKSLKKLKKYRLPNRFKTIGIGVIVFSLVSIIVNKTSVDNGLFTQTAKYGILLGLLFISLSKEKIEDELMINLKMQSYTFAFVISVIITLTNLLFTFITSALFEKQMNVFKGIGDWQVLWFLLSIQLFYFEFLKRVSR